MSTPTTSTDSPSNGDAPATHPAWAGRSALIIPALLLVLGVFLLIGNADMDVVGEAELFGPKAFPLITAIVCFVTAAWLTFSIFTNPEIPNAVDDEGAPLTTYSNWRTTAIVLGSFVLFTILLEPVGWIIAGALVFWGITVGLGSTRYVANLLIGLALSSIVQLVFGGLLGLTLPAGVFGMF
ncbi:MAG: tripartite tricarboxylate transporter TctB family protein [Gordonia sp. (in: high G+C Gram-positive bacteria)]|uniref:tripartite tricarboxylate transporter TctB family protein n=1 Tax=Gordonia sp. (in: high G+C Gram-positive bacteria) TaxID=84139 RepID=UPI0039E22048